MEELNIRRRKGKGTEKGEERRIVKKDKKI